MLLPRQRLALLIFLAVVSVAAAQPPRPMPSTARDSVREHVKRGAALEKIGFHGEAEAEFLTALAAASPAEISQITEALQRVREARKRAESVQTAETSEKYFQLGQQLEKQGHYDQALAAFQRALETANSPQAQVSAQAAIAHVLEAKDSFWHKYTEEWLKPAAKGFLSLVGVYLLYKILYKILSFIGPWLARFSKRIEVADFDDSTDVGFGKGFPALLRTLYEERKQLAKQSVTLPGSGVLTYRSLQVTLPVMGSPEYEDFSEIKLDVAGVQASKFLRKAARLLWQPRYSVNGTIYRYGNEIRAVTTLAKYNGVVERWNFALWDGQPGGPLPPDSAYQVIDAILKDWEQKNG